MAKATPFDQAQAEIGEFTKYIEEGEQEQIQFSKGAQIEAIVSEVRDSLVFLELDVAQKQNGECSLSEFEIAPKPGDKVPVVIIKNAGNEASTRVSHSEARRREAWQEILDAQKDGLVLTGTVKQEVENNKGYIIEFGGLRLFMPRSHVSARSRGAHLKIGDKVDFKIVEIKESNDRPRSAIVSRRLIQEEQDQEKWNQFQSTHNEGDETEGEIIRLSSFGVFVRIDGIDGLVHQTDLSWKPTRSIRENFKRGEQVKVKILTIDVENRRLSLGIKQLTEDPWLWAERELKEGQILEGVVTSIADYGAFVELKDGIEGLIHISELSWLNKLKHPKRYFEVGQTIQVYLLSLDFENKRVALSYRRARPNPWDAIDQIAKVGEVRTGQISSITKFGAFVELADEIEGLIHFKDYSWDDQPDHKMLHKGQSVEFKVLDIDKQGQRISCGIKQLTPGPYEQLKQKYKKGQLIDGKVTNVTSFGVFVDIGEGFEGLVHISQLPLRRDENIADRYKVGDAVQTVLLKIEANEKRISLSIKDYDRRQQKELMNRYMLPENEGYSFGALLKDNLKQQGEK
ncbi:MAG: S1 RNA-binding domain-containing protein [Leptonema sp. (in: Bacteria)]|nr:S1 RNA-binding domain-containing protein [Leptonema sp. (in: bacteria)]